MTEDFIPWPDYAICPNCGEKVDIPKRKKFLKTSGEEKYLSKILNVLDPIVDSLQRHFSESTLINERNVIEIIKNRHDKNWPTYKEKIILLHQKLHENKMSLICTRMR